MDKYYDDNPIGAPYRDDEDNSWDDYVPIGAPYHSDYYAEGKGVRKDDNDNDYHPIGAPYHDD